MIKTFLDNFLNQILSWLLKFEQTFLTVKLRSKKIFLKISENNFSKNIFNKLHKSMRTSDIVFKNAKIENSILKANAK